VTERRLDPLTGQWRTFATDRQNRTFLPPAADCPLCPTRPGGPETEIPAPDYDIVVFDNRFPSFRHQAPAPSIPGDELYQVEPAAGAAEVVVYSSRHDATFSDLGVERIDKVIEVWSERYAELSTRDEVAYVFIFENKGEAIGVTLSHPHGQIYGYPDIPPTIVLELAAASAHRAAHASCVTCDIVGREREAGSRLVVRGSSFSAYVPFAGRFPYEVHVAAHRHATSVIDLTAAERWDLAEVLDQVARGYDALFDFSLPYVMGVHQVPTDDGDWAALAHLHIEFTPVHRTADKLKYLAGSELSAGSFINDVSPEAAAGALRHAVERAAVLAEAGG
jgi:UDPglucose--hexose-1-phosphate uridylyltransferase